MTRWKKSDLPKTNQSFSFPIFLKVEERLAGASLLVLANKQDIASAATTEEIEEVLLCTNCFPLI